VQLSVADLFVAPSIEKMAQKISKQKTLGSVSPSPALFARDRFSTPTVSPEIYPGYGATVVKVLSYATVYLFLKLCCFCSLFLATIP
jgi:hypothetical protein